MLESYSSIPLGLQGIAYLVDLLDIGTALVNAVLQNELLQEHEGALVVRVLPHLQEKGGNKASSVTPVCTGCSRHVRYNMSGT